MLDAITCWWIGYTELTLSLWNASVCVVETVINIALDLKQYRDPTAYLVGIWPAVDLGGGDGGVHPPHQPKSNDFGPKISFNFEKLGSISGRIPPHQPKPNDFGRKITLNFGEDLFFLETT